MSGLGRGVWVEDDVATPDIHKDNGDFSAAARALVAEDPGPRELKDPRSADYAKQTMAALRRYVESEKLDKKHIEQELTRIRQYKHWEVLGYATEDELLKAGIGHDPRPKTDDIPRVEFVGISAQELARADYTPEWVVEDVLVTGAPGCIGGGFKSLKSLIAYDLALSIANAKPFLGVFTVNRAAKVAYMSGEGGRGLIQDYSGRVARSKGLELDDVAGITFFDLLPQIGNLEHDDALARMFANYETEILFIDPLYLAHGDGKGAGNVFEQGPLYRRLLAVCVQAGVTPILVHHSTRTATRRQRDTGAAPELGDLSFAGPAEFSGQWIMLGRREEYDPNDPGEHRMSMVVGGRAGQSLSRNLDIHEGSRHDEQGRRWEVEVKYPDRTARKTERDNKQAALQERREDEQRQRLIEALKQFPDGETERELRLAAHLNPDTFLRALRTLQQRGEVEPCRVQKGHRDHPAWRLKT